MLIADFIPERSLLELWTGEPAGNPQSRGRDDPERSRGAGFAKERSGSAEARGQGSKWIFGMVAVHILSFLHASIMIASPYPSRMR